MGHVPRATIARYYARAMAMGEEQHRQHLEAVMSSDLKLISLAPELDTTSYLFNKLRQ